MGVSYICGIATMLFGFITGPFASLIVGGILLAVASRIYSNAQTEKQF
jgi:hypothetical protein